MRTIPYTHWRYFDDRGPAERCSAELARLDFLCGVDFRPPPSEEEKARLAAEYPALAADLSETPPYGHWLLRAARETTDLTAQHELVEEITVRHGGLYGGGETGLMDPRTGKFIRQAEEGS
jgi:hypothetical protein